MKTANLRINIFSEWYIIPEENIRDFDDINEILFEEAGKTELDRDFSKYHEYLEKQEGFSQFKLEEGRPVKFKVIVGDYFLNAGITADWIVENEDGHILLIKRRADGLWALPGGFFNAYDNHEAKLDESVVHAARRELYEETSLLLEKEDFKFFGFYDWKYRDPRQRVVTFVFHARVKNDLLVKAGDDATEFQWYKKENWEELELAFDHKDILDDFYCKKFFQGVNDYEEPSVVGLGKV